MVLSIEPRLKKKRSRKDTTMVCKGSGNVPTFISCLARQYISYGKKSVTVYHYGEHLCPVIKKPEKGVEYIDQLVENNPNIKPSQIQSACEFHYKDRCNKMSKKLDSKSSEIFVALCNSLLESTTLSAYDDAKCKMDDFINENEERMFLASWISWWNDRCGFIFCGFIF